MAKKSGGKASMSNPRAKGANSAGGASFDNPHAKGAGSAAGSKGTSTKRPKAC